MKKRFLDIRNTTLIVGITLLILFYIGYFIYGFQIEINGGVDYLAHYSAGYIMRYEKPSEVYNQLVQKSVQVKIFKSDGSSQFYPYNHPPLLLGILRLLTDTNYLMSYIRWLLMLLVFHLLGLIIQFRLMTFVGWTPSPDLWIFCVSSFLFYPAFLAYIRGQDSTFFLLGISLWSFGILTSQDKYAGLGLTLALIRPQIIFVLVIPFLFKRQKVLMWFILFSILLFIYCYFLVGYQGLIGFVEILFVSGQGYGFDVDKMITFMGAIQRAFPTIEPQMLHFIGYGGYFLAIIPLCILWVKSKFIELKHIGLALLVSMLVTPHMHNHDFVILLIPTMGATVSLIKFRGMSQKFAPLLPLCVSLVLLLKDITNIFLLTYLLFILLAVLLWFPARFMINARKFNNIDIA